jgi:hypothetical protein
MRERRWPGARTLGQTRAAARGSGPARLARLLGYARLGRGSARWAGEGARWADARRWPGGLRAGRQAAGALKFCGPRGCGRPFSFCFSTFSISSFFLFFTINELHPDWIHTKAKHRTKTNIFPHNASIIILLWFYLTRPSHKYKTKIILYYFGKRVEKKERKRITPEFGGYQKRNFIPPNSGCYRDSRS